MRLIPVLDRPADVPVRAPDRGQARGCAPRGVDVHRLRAWASRARRRRRSSARRSRAALDAAVDLPAGRGAAGAARGDRRLGRAALRRARWIPTPRSSRRSAPRRRSSTSPRSSTATWSRVTTPGYPVPERGALFAGREVVELPLRARARLPARPRRACRGDAGRASVLWLNYPNNPTAATAPLELLRARRRRWPASTTSCWPATRPTRELYFGAEPPVSALQVADRTQRRRSSTRSPSARRCPATGRASRPATRELIAALKRYRPERRRRAAGVRPARRGRRVGRRGARRRGARRSTAPSATSLLPALRGARACATPAATRRSSCGCEPARRRRRGCAERAARARHRRRARRLLRRRPARATCALALVPTLEECAARRPQLLSRWRAARR